jgi:GDP-4-dehydro-6-deoxy-D-mannose reductase
MNKKRKIKRVLITGVSGSGGSYLAEYILEHHPNVQVYGIARGDLIVVPKNLEKTHSKMTIQECDLNDFSSILTILKKTRPNAIFHLASNANVRASFINPIAVLDNNIRCTANLLEAIRAAEIDPIVQICSTSEVYGQVSPKDVPIKELCPLNPMSPYAVSKTTQDLLGAVYFRAYDMKIIRTRMFAYINPRREGLFATSFAMQVARIEAGIQKELLHGNLNSTRTLIDVRDAMSSYWVAIEKCCFGEVYNIGGNTIITVGEFLDILKKKAHVKIPSRLDPKLLRPTDVTLQIPDVTKFTKETGWRPKYSFEESVEFLLEHCRNKVARENSANKVHI